MFKNLTSHLKNFFDAKLPFEILEEFKPLQQEYINEKGTYGEFANNNSLIFDIKTKKSGVIFAVMAAVALIFFYLTGDKEEMFNSPDIYI